MKIISNEYLNFIFIQLYSDVLTLKKKNKSQSKSQEAIASPAQEKHSPDSPHQFQPIPGGQQAKANNNNNTKVDSNDGTVYIKILTTYLQIVSCISTFQLSFETSFLDAPNSVGQPISQSTNSFECLIQQYVRDS